MIWPTYAEYRDSRVPWIGPIPSDWRTAAVKRSHQVTLGKMLQSEPKTTADRYMPYLRAAHIQPNGMTFDAAEQSMWVSPSEVAELTLRSGDVVVVEGGAGYGRSATLTSDLEGWAFQNSINRLRALDGNIGRFTDYCIQAALWSGYIEVTCGVATIPHLTAEKLGQMRIPNPPPATQRIICQFLDRETAKIDALIGKQEQLIDTLREDRTATITHAVTTGLDPDVEMKDSGVAGLDRLPSSWTVKPFVRCVENQVDYRGATPRKVSDGVTLVTARNVRPGWIDYEASTEFVAVEDYDTIMRRGLPRIDDLLLTMEAPLGNVALVDRTDIALAQRIVKFRADPQGIIAKFLLYSMMGAWFQSQLLARATGSTALGLKASKLPELRIAVPPLKEQAQIVKFLDERCTRIDALTTKADEVIETLREYRSVLITDAVTGKIDVRKTA